MTPVEAYVLGLLTVPFLLFMLKLVRSDDAMSRSTPFAEPK